MSVEINRHLFHITSGTLLALLFYFNLITKTHFAILLVICVVLSFLYRSYKIPILHQAMKILERKENLRKLPGIGVLFYLAGCTVAVWIYQKEIALAAIMILAWGDGMAGMVRAYKKKPEKTWLSTIVAIFSGTIAAQFFVLWIPALTASIIAMLVERLNLRKLMLDDNLVIPVIAGLVITLF